ncbi:hypothetical protein QCA50_010335 [Cerrena zonata]|uniref:Wbp11/ELF5/Saf1 N-terminal domain-containing protein n=1 Tax=Cerrena zonata TaxID=2478898 RepID=A0AAW0G6H4_9APHY
MAKGKTANPADSFRKAQRKKELKKAARDFALVKKDTRDLEDELEKLEGLSERSPKDNARLAELKSELEKITKKKEEWVAEHPEHRKLVFKARRRNNEEKDEDEIKGPELKSRNLFNKKGLPRHPERSVYFDPVMNPYGVPPPGMPYMERPLRPDEVDSEAEEGQLESGDDDDIAMPAGPPPGRSDDEEEDSDDDIPMPDGPPPPKDGIQQQAPLPPTPGLSSALPLPAGFMLPPPPPGFQIPPGGLPPPPPPGFPMQPPPFPPTGFPMPPPPNMLGLPPPPPPGFPPGFVPPPGFISPPPPGFSQNSMPPPPPGFFPRRGHNQSMGSMQDPLSSLPHQTFQAHRASRPPGPSSTPITLPPAHPSLPSKPAAPISSEAIVSAEPELRDFKKESTAFVPAALKRKKGATSAAKVVNAAPTLEPNAGEEESASAPRPDLLGTLKSQLGPSMGRGSATSVPVKPKPKDDYEKFMAEMGDILGKPA